MTNSAGDWTFFLGGEASGYVTGDVAATWNDHAARSDAGLDDAADAIAANDAALHEASTHLGTDPAGFDAAAAQATSSFEATFDNQLASLGLSPGTPVAGAGDLEQLDPYGADPFDVSHYDSDVDGF